MELAVGWEWKRGGGQVCLWAEGYFYACFALSQGIHRTSASEGNLFFSFDC